MVLVLAIVLPCIFGVAAIGGGVLAYIRHRRNKKYGGSGYSALSKDPPPYGDIW